MAQFRVSLINDIGRVNDRITKAVDLGEACKLFAAAWSLAPKELPGEHKVVELRIKEIASD